MVVAPEMVLPGYCIGDLIENVDFLAANDRAALRIADAARGITAVFGFIDYDLDARNDNGTVRKYNAAAVVRDGQILQRAHKSLLPNYRYFDDKRFFTPGERREPVEIETRQGPVRIGVSICEDMWDEFYEIKPLPELVEKGAEVLLNLNASPFYPGKRHERDALIRQHVAELRRPLVYVNTIGAADNGKNVIAFDGESLVYDEHGRLIAVGPQFEEALLVVDVSARAADAPPHAIADLPEIQREREMYDALVMGLRDYMRKTGFTRDRRAGLGGHRLRARPGHRGGCGRRAAGRGLQPAVAVQHRDDTVDRGAAGAGARRPLRRHPDLVDRRGGPRRVRIARAIRSPAA